LIPEIGHFALILALCMALLQSTVPLIGAARGNRSWVALARPAARAQLLFMLIAFASLTYAFIVHDFSVAYVQRNSNTNLPLIYCISGVWGAHEGSLLLWGTVLAIWTGAVTVFNRSVPEVVIARVLAVMGMVSIGFLLFMLLTSNPFVRQFPVPLHGNDLNPLLQDPGLAIHPPMLYMGYVGFSVAFAFAIAAMLGGRLDTAWARWSRPWTLVAWVFLTLGIVLGSWWSYYELGWGGWWFWDPVENASFMPWLVGTALIHSLAATENRSAFKAWTVLLAIFAFSLSLLGTFLVRSGVLTSVHAFASDPTRGVFVLIFLSLVVGGSLGLYAWRGPQIRSTARFSLISRETGILLNNVVLVATSASILLGTLYPLAVDALGLGKISVGPPYFNRIFIPLMIPIALVVGLGAIARWKQDSLWRLLWQMRWAGAATVVLLVISVVLMPHFSLAATGGLLLAFWVAGTTLLGLYRRVAAAKRGAETWKRVPRAFYGMSLAHLGIAVLVVGVSLTTTFSQEEDVRLAPGQSYELGGYHFEFDGVRQVRGPNYTAHQGTVTVTRNGKLIATMSPQKRVYDVQRQPMTEAAIDPGLTRDLFVALGEPLGTSDGSWSVRLYHKPFIRWIWMGGVFMALGGLLAASDRRYRVLARRRATAQESSLLHSGAAS
jgi:cytochrome c-type biogenesis protein CcmF